MFEECRREGDFTLSSGRKSPYFYDLDLLKPEETAAYAEQLFRVIPKDILRETQFIAVPALGGIAVGFLVAFAARKPLVILDKSGNLRGPEVKGGTTYFVVDDVCTSFQAVNKVRAALPDSKCLGIASFIFRGSRKDLDAQNVPVFYLARKEPEI